mgnify:CR=1 FL=1
MVLPDMPKNVEATHGFHLHVGDDEVRLNRVHLLDRFRGRVKRENLVTFFAA